MKILCLPGAYGSAKNFQVQLGSFVAETEKRGNAEFVWTQGTREAIPPPGFEDYFGAGPLWRFIDYDGSKAFDIVDRIREFPQGPNAEATMRLLMGDQPSYALSSVQEAIHRLLDIIDADPEIEGILGYSEGATTAATLILEERRLWDVEKRPRRIKRAIFFAGWPPLSMAGGKIQVLLADQDKDVIDIPSLHVIGCNDPYISGAVALYNMCDRDTAEIFDHGKGHTVPRDARTIQELCDAIERLTTASTSFDTGEHGGVGSLNIMSAVQV
ncbi:hypothetical protein N0V93_008091 [Gnomoniopsis smithogilvyi]|uniref:Serine hydrolase domain-containing protein n=1 Tax=Gnomoniopsis smithogilvyi TaxID=1191159 RepID=A0A9W9CUE7_9PEZI|nr:hypothetical protein N0V93_008091 [Gnomoniopsis smithogilvyi]